MANNLAAFNSEAWSLRMVEKLDQMNVMLRLVNRNWEGDLRQNKTVWVRTPGNIVMSSYTRGTTISYQDLTATKESFTVNDGEYFAFEVDDLDKAQSDLSAMDTYTGRAVVALNNTIEAKLLATYSVARPFRSARRRPARRGPDARHQRWCRGLGHDHRGRDRHTPRPRPCTSSAATATGRPWLAPSAVGRSTP